MSKPYFESLIQLLSRKLYGFAFRILRNQEEAEDAVQEIFVKLWKMGEKLNEYKSIDALATTMTRNFCLDMLRRQKHSFIVDLNIDNYQELTSPSPHEQIENRESNDIIFNIIENLSES